MKTSILYEEGYEYNSDSSFNNLNFHFDYGRRYHEINMQFQHFHSSYEIYVLLQGKTQHIIEGRPYELNEYDFVLLSPYRLHKTNYYKNSPCCRLILSFDLTLFESIFPQATQEIEKLFLLDPPVFRFDEEIILEFIKRFNNMFITSKTPQPTTDFLITSYLMHFFNQFVQEQSKNIYLSDNQEDSTKSKIYQIASYIHTHLHEELSLSYLSKFFFMSPHHLSRQFKLVTHFNLVDYIHQTRVKKAQELLLNTNLKVIEIIEECGFGSLSQFNRVFNNITNTSPTAFRKANKLSNPQLNLLLNQRT